MSRQTIDYGIDLGTTNSEIAFIDPGAPPSVVENNYNERITPSAVAYSKKGQLQVGKTANNYFAGRWEDMDNVHIQFKRRMGTDDTFLFPYTGKKYRADQLSAEILKELRLSVERKRGEQIDAVIVTIPAAFEQPQIAATKKAAEQAGFLTCELLQEPVAASLAYGIRDSGAKGYWLVYDLGGGTFDAALLQLKDGLIRVVNHCGDNYLGGKDIDNAILDRIILPRIAEEYGIDDFNRGEERWKYAIARIRYFAEIAKIELSKSKTAELRNIDRIWDPIEEIDVDLRDFEFELTRDSVAPLYQTIYQKSANYVKDLLSQSKINPVAIEKIILVGGPTQFPLIREGLAAELKAPLDFSRDVMTVVAEGAAVFASTRRITRTKPHKAASGSVIIEFDYEPGGADSEPNIGGSVKLGQGSDSELFTIELVNVKSQWRSGKLKLSKNGAFIIPALADKGLNEYRVELCDQNGTLLATNPPSLTYNLTGIEVQAQTLIHNISLSEPDGKPFKILSKGQSFPIKGIAICQTDHLIKKGSDDALIIKLFEGNNPRFAARNSPIGHVRVEAKDMPRDLPAGQEVEVKLRLDGAGNFQGTAEVLLFNMDEPYQITWTTQNIYEKLQPSQLSQMSEQAFERLAKLRSSSTHDSLASEVFLKIEAEDVLAQIEESLQAARVDKDQASKCHKLLLRLNELLDDIDDRNKRPALEKEAQRAIEYAKDLVEKEKSDSLTQTYQRLFNEINAAMKDPDFYALVQAAERMDRFIYSVLRKHPEWWVRGFQFADENRHLMTDPQKAERLFAQGRKSIDEQDLESLKAAVNQLMNLLPVEIQARAEDFGNVWGTRVN
jgi:molecular chaperone DnaK